ncbi:MAG: tetratricopeptide repeat protein, partial [Cyanobacteriota bacterium]
MSENFEELFLKANDCLATGEYIKSIELYKKCLELSPSDKIVYNNIGNAYSAAGRHKDAIKAFDEALEIDNKDASIWANLGITYSSNGD